MLACILLLFSALLFSLKFKPVQTYVAKKAASYLSKELKTRIEIDGLFIKPFKSLVLEGLFVQDLEKDTLLYSPRFTIDLNSFSLKGRKVSVNIVQLDNGKVYLKQYKDSTTNVEFIINYFDTGTTKPKKKPRKPYDVTFDKIVLNNIEFKYKNFNHTQKVYGINFNDILLTKLNGIIANLDTKNHLVKADFSNLSLKEKSGFYLKNLTTNATIDTNQMEFKNLLLETSQSHLEDYLLMKYSKFKDFNSFVDKVFMKVHFKDARIHSKDVAYFAHSLSKMNLDLRVDGNASGLVNNLRGKNLAIEAGNATYLKGDFTVKGLPNTKNIFMDLDFDKIQTNKKDLDYIIAKATGSNKVFIPSIVNKFGMVYFKGRLSGSINDLVSYGEFKTALGRVKTDVNLKIVNKIPIYSGIVKAYDFNLGELIDQKILGRTTFTANLEGSGSEVNRLREKIKSTITYFDFKGYRYQNIKVNGSFINKLFDGQIKINDPNIKLDFAGGVNLNSKLPEFRFTSAIRGANLHKLNLIKDTVQIDADFTTNFTGSNLDNIQGNLEVRRARLTDSENTFVVDSFTLAASGLGNDRSLEVKSDILDARITGQYDLNTLPSYFKSVIKKYAPSIKLAIVKPKPQNFNFTLTLKQFAPISLLFIPKLKVPEGARFNGKFVSAQNIATLNGFSKLIEYGDIKINNLIIDETTTVDALNISITSDRVDLTDSLYVKNINIANILHNDSLNLNIKLSDLDATNQLDLNGLIAFNEKTFASLSILPSDVVINREDWKVQDKVRISYDKGRIGIENFELFRNDQLLTINGFISSSADDLLDINFNHFKLKTFNALTQSAGINFAGELNGEMQVAAITKTPKINADIKIDSLIYNKTSIGTLTLTADFDNSSRLVNVDMDVLNDGKKTLDIIGTYNAASNKNSLDMDIKMRDNELIIFEPLLKKLVSNLNGHVSADLKLSGVVTHPKIDGHLSLKDAGMTVNYLKTSYKISDELKVANSVITLDELELRDVNKNTATASGTVDMGNPNNPTINISIDAKRFMALNTTEKDNPLYYGTAFGTGSFNFNGPTNNMRININAKTEPGTVFNIPLNSSETIGNNDFITFVAKDSVLTPKKITSFNGLTMNFSLAVDQNTEVNIITDLGKLTGRGDATIALNISSLGDFEMFGDYLIQSGKFVFTSQDFINKIFDISQGGSIRWTGNPTLATINLKAVYAVRTNVDPLYIAAGRVSPQLRILSEAIMNLKGSLLKPDIAFDLDFPNDAYVKDELQSYLSDVNNRNQQALNLIVRRSFAANTGFGLGDVRGSVISAGTELAFNQLNNYISQALNLNTVDLNIRSLNEASASLRLWNDRIILTGGVTDRRNNIQDIDIIGGNIARDVEAQYLIRKDGTLIMKASNRLNNRNFLNPNEEEYISAIGLVYRQEFDTLGEFIRKFVGKGRVEEREEKLKKPIKVPPTEVKEIEQPQKK